MESHNADVGAMQLFIVWTENDPRNWKLFMAAERIQHMFLTEKICVFRKIKTDGKTTTYISSEDRHPREIRRKEYYSTHKDDRAKPLHIQLDIEHGDRALERQALTSVSYTHLDVYKRQHHGTVPEDNWCVHPVFE